MKYEDFNIIEKMLKETLSADKNNNVFSTKSDNDSATKQTDENKNQAYLKNRRKNDALENLNSLPPDDQMLNQENKVFCLIKHYQIILTYLKYIF